MKYVILCECHLSLNVFSRFISIAECINALFLFYCLELHYVDIVCFIYLFTH